MKDDDRWYWQDADQKPVGPFDRSALRQLFAAGVVTDDTMIARVGTEEWMPLAFVGPLNGPVTQDDDGDPSEIRLACPGCGQSLSATTDQQGMEFKCPNCDGQVVVPAAAQPSRVQSTTERDAESEAVESATGSVRESKRLFIAAAVIVGILVLIFPVTLLVVKEPSEMTTVHPTVGNESHTGKLEGVKVECTLCNGKKEILSPSICRACGARGTRMTPSGYSYLCADCGGSGKVMAAETCYKCGGIGFSWRAGK